MHNVKVKDCALPIHCLQFVKSDNFDSIWLSFCPFQQKSCNSLAKELGSVLEQHSNLVQMPVLVSPRMQLQGSTPIFDF